MWLLGNNQSIEEVAVEVTGMFPRLRLLLPTGPTEVTGPRSFWTPQALSSRSLTYFWTHSSLGSAQTCRPLLVRKLWRREEGLSTGESSRGILGPPWPHYPTLSWAAQGLLISQGPPAYLHLESFSQGLGGVALRGSCCLFLPVPFLWAGAALPDSVTLAPLQPQVR